jgi:Raf kinase inhibitor-like YbhB/YbcL family protein
VLVHAVLAAAFALTSPAFHDGGRIPVRYTCDGVGVSPPLRWTAPPRGTTSLTLTVTDPDAPGGNFVHWRASGISPEARGLRQGQHAPKEGLNSANGKGWTGPCPPSGTHRYVFVLRAYAGKRVVGTARLVGRYSR